MKTDSTTNLVIAGVLIATATALGAFGTHALKPVLPPARFDSFEIGVTYQFFTHSGYWVLLFCREAIRSLQVFDGA